MPEADTIDRVIACKRIHNFRDYGGYATSHGRLRDGWLYRSAQHFDANADDLARVAALGLAVVIDLRGKTERREAPCPRPEGFDAEIVAIEDETVSMAPHVDAARAEMTGAEARESMANAYITMPFRPVLMQLYSRYFEKLAEVDGPSLIHCLAGKDRTGIAVALLHHIVGVHHDDMMSDYMMTNVTGNIEERVKAGGRHIKARMGEMSDDALRGLMSVEPRYLENGFVAMAEKYGSIDAYLAEGLGVTPERRERIIARLTV
ncbi:MAG: tyrosine-protein phosphatase [Sphingomonadales bacterium]|nr:tyrosine-protein phosphatase [Sphingomonadales bacterium]